MHLTLGFPIRFDVFCTPRYVLAYNLLHLKAIVFIFSRLTGILRELKNSDIIIT